MPRSPKGRRPGDSIDLRYARPPRGQTWPPPLRSSLLPSIRIPGRFKPSDPSMRRPMTRTAPQGAADESTPGRRSELDIFSKCGADERVQLARSVDAMPFYRAISSSQDPVVTLDGQPVVMLG